MNMKMDEKIDDEMMDEPEHKERHWKDSEHDRHHVDYKERKMMTMDDVSECLQKDFAEEIADSKKYLCMAKIADCAGDEYDSHYLLEMAKDEYTHAHFIHDFMERHDICILEEQEECFHELKEKMAEFF